MYNSNEALKALTDVLANIVEVQVDSVTDDKVSLYGVRGKITFGIFFDTQKQLFGFNLLTGGVKTFKTIEQFVAMFDTYAYINVVFIPKAKVVADTFEKDLSLNSVYKTFVGNKNIGFSAIFQVLGADTQLIVTECKEENLFKADYVQPTTGGEKTVIVERFYTLSVEDDGTMECYRKLEVSEILDTLMKKSWEDADKFLDFKILGNMFEVTMKDFSYRMKVEATTESEVMFKLIAVNGAAVDSYCMRPEDWQDLSSISDSTISLYESMIKPEKESVEKPAEEVTEEESVSEEVSTEVNEEVAEESAEELAEEGTGEVTEEFEEEHAEESTEEPVEEADEEVGEEVTEDPTEEEVSEESGVAETEDQKETVEAEEVAEPVSEETFKEEEMSDLRLCLAYKDGECQGVLASLNNELILFDLDIVNSSCLYLDRVTESEELENKAGVAMYPSERSHKKFARRGTAEDLDSVISTLFGF